MKRRYVRLEGILIRLRRKTDDQQKQEQRIYAQMDDSAVQPRDLKNPSSLLSWEVRKVAAPLKIQSRRPSFKVEKRLPVCGSRYNRSPTKSVDESWLFRLTCPRFRVCFNSSNKGTLSNRLWKTWIIVLSCSAVVVLIFVTIFFDLHIQRKVHLKGSLPTYGRDQLHVFFTVIFAN